MTPKYIMDVLHGVTQDMDEVFQRVRKHFLDSGYKLYRDDLTIRQHLVLRAVDNLTKDGVGAASVTNQSRIVDSTGIDRSTLANMVANLTSKGLLHSVRAQHADIPGLDARSKAVLVTDLGFDVLDAYTPILAGVHRALANVSIAGNVDIETATKDAIIHVTHAIAAHGKTGTSKPSSGKSKPKPSTGKPGAKAKSKPSKPKLAA